MKKALLVMMIVLLASGVADAKKRYTRSKACKNHGGVCSCQCCDGTFAAPSAANYYSGEGNYYEPSYKYGLQPVSIIINGYRFDINGVLVKGHTFVPLRGIFEHLGASVDFLNDTGEVMIKYGSRTLLLRVGSNSAKAYSDVYYLDAPPVVINGITYVPLRFVTDFLGVHIDWNYYDNTVRITSGRYYREPYYFVW